MYELALISHHCPGLGDPMNLSLDVWNGVIKQIPRLLGLEK
jgi:hypothetical protein